MRRSETAATVAMMKRILITGASRGIGRAIAEKLAAPDATLLLHGRDTVALAETCKAVESRCAGVVKLVHDLHSQILSPVQPARVLSGGLTAQPLAPGGDQPRSPLA